MVKFNRILFSLFIPIIMGCAAIAVSGAGLGVNYTLTNVAYKTFNFPLDQVNEATVLALKKMDIKVEYNRKTEEGRRIQASTRELKIIIDLERITSKATKIKVNAKKGPVLKDKETAAEIINQADRILEGK